ncbi:EamA family transporter RarD [Phytohabitans sp. ZYX-F-186]|uniref:EamA family transporter RarD n=1 Tax=Phytohabitans maris TaxID=3071409 RepID=A0ABU0ZPQ0_9ACTN|nr:EamA family transporter RarD [Phytohabitans sp. ZYX-F-186]MDQ7908387.1 EamA family transporter RarD [Phytohabitans sp. ZYX-F-186]
MSELRRGYLFGIGAYTLWGFFPLYIRVLLPAGAVEILAHRVVWSVAFVALLLTLVRRWRFLRELARRPGRLAGICLASALIAVNWGMYIYGINSEHVVETALGYFIGPLVMVLLGVVALRERLNPAQWTAVGIGTLAVAVLTIDYGRLPFIALTLAASFGGYSLVKKRLALPAAEGLLVESAALALPALAYLAWLTARGDSTFGQGAGHTALLIVAGAATATPLLLFAGAANRVPMTGIGILQYIAPILQLGCGVLIFHEPMPPARLAGFALVWLALVVFTVDGLRTARRRTPEREPALAG